MTAPVAPESTFDHQAENICERINTPQACDLYNNYVQY